MPVPVQPTCTFKPPCVCRIRSVVQPQRAGPVFQGFAAYAALMSCEPSFYLCRHCRALYHMLDSTWGDCTAVDFAGLWQA